MGNHRDHQSLIRIGQALHIPPNKLQAALMSNNSGVVLLEELTNENPYFPLAQLCRVFVQCDRLDCVDELQSMILAAGGKLDLPMNLTTNQNH